MAVEQRIKVYPLYLGDMESESSYTIKGDTQATPADPHAPHRLLRTPSTAYLIDHPQVGWILYDTGMPDDPKEAWPDWMYSSMKVSKPEECKMANQLAKVGVKPEDIKYVISSHWHMDHVGSDAIFAETADFICSKAEAAHALTMVMATTDSSKRGYYIKEEVLRTRKSIRYLEHDTMDLFPGIDAYILSGHTPGLLALVVHLEGQDLILVEDAIPCQANYDGVLPGGAYDTLGFRASLELVHELQKKYDALVLFGHDEKQFEGMKFAPEYYA